MTRGQFFRKANLYDTSPVSVWIPPFLGLGFPLSLRWRHNERDGVSNHQPHDSLLKRLFRCRSKKTSKLRVTGLCEGNSPVTGEFPAQRTSNAENVSIWWPHHVKARRSWVRLILYGNAYTGKTVSVYWDDPRVVPRQQKDTFHYGVGSIKSNMAKSLRPRPDKMAVILQTILCSSFWWKRMFDFIPANGSITLGWRFSLSSHATGLMCMFLLLNVPFTFLNHPPHKNICFNMF